MSHAEPLSDIEMIAVERALSELRAGRAIVLRRGAEQIFARGLESFEDGEKPQGRLALTAARLRGQGLERLEGGAIDLAGLTSARLFDLGLNRGPHSLPPVAPLTALEASALELAKLALILPAMIVSAHGPAHALDVPAEAVDRYRAAQVARLSLLTRAPVPLEGAERSEFVVFRGGEGLRDQVAIVVGTPDFACPVPVRLHSACLTGDLFGSLKCDCGDQLRSTVRAMAEGEGGIILYLDQEGRGTGIGNKMRAYALQAQGLDTFDADEILGFEHDERHFEFAARMLQVLGVSKVRLMTNNPAKAAALRSAGLEVTETMAVLGRLTHQNRGYLQTKRDRGGHVLDLEAAARIPE